MRFALRVRTLCTLVFRQPSIRHAYPVQLAISHEIQYKKTISDPVLMFKMEVFRSNYNSCVFNHYRPNRAVRDYREERLKRLAKESCLGNIHALAGYAVSRSVAQPGSAPQWGCGGRRFKSSRSDQNFLIYETNLTCGNSLQNQLPQP